MADDSQELTTEQILASIREILLDEDKKTQPKKEINKKVDDVLELTPAMILKEEKIKPAEDVKPIIFSNEKKLYQPRINFSSEEAARNIIKSFTDKFSNIKNETFSSRQSYSDEESMLRSSISKSVEDWVLKNMKSDFELQKNIKEEVAKQVNVWFDANLVKLVNSTIRQELERVMVKVDSAQ